MSGFPCDLCSRSYRIKSALILHINQVHLKLKEFSCNQYVMNFHKKVHLSSHIRNKHRNCSPYQCEICKKEYSTKSNLNKHIKTIHERSQFKIKGQQLKKKQEKVIRCVICSQDFRKKLYSNHISNDHQELKCFVRLESLK